MSDHDRFRDECGAYVLGALEDNEAAALREHLASCVVCRDDVERLTAVAEVLGLGVPALSAPPELRARVMEQVRSEAELFEAAAPRRAQSRRTWLKRWPASGSRPLAGAVGAALALGIVLGALVVAPGATSTRVVRATVADASRWHIGRAPTALLRESGTQGELVLRGLPRAPSGRIYEVWIRRARQTVAAKVLFDATSSGSAIVAVPDLAGASAVMVTAERLGGSEAPTMAPLLVAQLS